jgi:hypothetical protein
MRFAVVVISALLVASPAVALAQPSSGNNGVAVRSSNEAPQGSSEPGTNESGERRICRRVESTANRSSSRRVCLTQREWRDYNRE